MMAEGAGFEPAVPVSQNTRFPSVHFRPLSHPSIRIPADISFPSELDADTIR
jgi:hypothetical protein